jgi:site-specific recombinase XerD
MSELAYRLTPDDWQAILCDPVRDKAHLSTALGPDLIDYLAWAVTEARKAPRTVDQYERDLARGTRMFPTVACHDWTKQHVRAVLAAFPPGSQPRAWAAHSDFWKWMWDEERTEATPMRGVRRPKPAARKIPEVFTPAERLRLVEAASAGPLGVIDKARVLILLDVGLRKGEALGLRISDVNVADSLLLVRQAKGGDERVMGYGQELQRALLDLLFADLPIRCSPPRPDDYIWFPHGASGQRNILWLKPQRPMAQSTFHRWWERLIARAGVRYRKPHTTRHTYGTELQEATGDILAVSEALGHASTRTTEIYVHAGPQRMRRSVASLEEYRKAQVEA